MDDCTADPGPGEHMGRSGFRVSFRPTAAHQCVSSLGDGMASDITCVAVPSPPHKLAVQNPNVARTGILYKLSYLSSYRPFASTLEESTSTPLAGPPKKPATVFCMSFHSVSRGIAMSPMSYTYNRPSLPPKMARRPSLRSHCSLLRACSAVTVVVTTGT